MEPSHETETTKWWQTDTVRLSVLTIGFIAAVILLYQANWSGLQGKNVWDWLELIIVPLVLAGGGLLLQRIEDRRTAREEAHEKQQARDNLMDSIFQSYLDDMSDLMINHQLQTNLDIVTAHRDKEQTISSTDNELEKPSDESLAATTVEAAKLAEATAVVTVARARTVTVLKSLDVTRRNLLSNFLRETALVTGKRGTLLTHVDLSEMDLSKTDFYNFNFTGSLFYRTNLSDANLLKTNLMNAYLHRANLRYAGFSGTNLRQACLHLAQLEHAHFENVQFDDKTVLPDGEIIAWDIDYGAATYTKYWSKDTDMGRYTDPDHPDFFYGGGTGLAKGAMMAKLGSVDH